MRLFIYADTRIYYYYNGRINTRYCNSAAGMCVMQMRGQVQTGGDSGNYNLGREDPRRDWRNNSCRRYY